MNQRADLKRIFALLGALGSASLSDPAVAQIIDHHTISSVASLPQATMDHIGKLRWYFIHASVGDNIMQGLRDLHGSNAVRYPLLVSTIPTDSSPPASTIPGTVYEHHFSTDKMPQFQAMVNSNGWRNPAVEITLMKFCYLDGLATSLTPALQLVNQYVTMLQPMEQTYPDTVIMYVSMPLLIYREADDPRRDPNYLPSLVSINLFNDWLRGYCRTHDKLLYDLADMESHDPDGNETTFTWTNGQSYAAIYGPYVYNTAPGANSGHLIALGRRQVAMGWYAVAAAIASRQTAGPKLNWNRDTQGLRFTWSTSGFTLQQNTNVAEPASWQDVIGGDQGSHAVTNDMTPSRFFRLRR